MRKRRRTFASPFVLTVGIGCGGKAEPVDCPEELLPDALPGELIVGHNTRCFRVYERKLGNRGSRTYFDEGEVRCPPEGPNVRLPKPTYVEIKSPRPPGTDRFVLEEESLTCRRRVWANPPYYEPSVCPEEILPELVGLDPEARAGTHCTYQGVTFKCPAKPKP